MDEASAPIPAATITVSPFFTVLKPPAQASLQPMRRTLWNNLCATRPGGPYTIRHIECREYSHRLNRFDKRGAPPFK